MIEGARNDYDLRRTMEAAAMSGKKKATEASKERLQRTLMTCVTGRTSLKKQRSVTAKVVTSALASDYMGLTRSMVERDRQKFSDGLATVDDMNALRDDLEQQEEATNHQQQQPMEKSDALARAEDRLAEAESSPGRHNGGNLWTIQWSCC